MLHWQERWPSPEKCPERISSRSYVSARTIESVLADNTTLQEQVKTLTAERDKNAVDLTAAKAERDTAQGSLKTLTAERDTAQASVTTLTKERDDLKAANTKLSAESKDFAARVAAEVKALGIVPGKAGASGGVPDKVKNFTEQCQEAADARKKAA
jgi:chromosome segregation ATPase